MILLVPCITLHLTINVSPGTHGLALENGRDLQGGAEGAQEVLHRTQQGLREGERALPARHQGEIQVSKVSKKKIKSPLLQ